MISPAFPLRMMLKKFENFWEWAKFVIDDIAEWSSLEAE